MKKITTKIVCIYGYLFFENLYACDPAKSKIGECVAKWSRENQRWLIVSAHCEYKLVILDQSEV